MSEKFCLVVGILVGTACLVFARRIKNDDKDAGTGIVAWGIILTIIVLLAKI